MKNLILKSTMFVSAAVLMGLGAQAQSIKVSVPFAFEASGKSLPAGDYKVQGVSLNNGGLFSMRNIDTSDVVLLSGKHPVGYGDGDTRLVFQRAADGYYLTEIWDGAMGRAVQSPRGRNSIVASTKVVIAAHK